MGAGTVTVGRRVYAAGLYWENSPSGRRMAQAAREAAKHPGQQADFYALRPGTKDGRVPQFGLGQKSAGHKPGMPVFAACLTNQQIGSWVGAFRVKEGIVVCVVRDDLIVPDGDQLFTNESEARDRILQEISFGGLQRVYAPEAWAIPAADSMPISLLMDERRDIILRNVAVPRNVLIFGAAAAALLLIALAVGWYIQAKNAEEAAAEAARQAAYERAREAANKMLPGFMENGQPKYPPPDRKWEKRPLPLTFITTCTSVLGQVPIAVSGWRLDRIRCDGSSLAVTWSREKGITLPPKGSSVNELGSVATVSIPLPNLSPREAENLVDPDEISRRYLGQDWPGTISAAPDDPPPPPPPGYQGTWNPPPPPWIKRSFTLAVPVLPAGLPLYFGGLPGVVINALSFSPANLTSGTWTIEGVIYENRT